MNSWLITLSAAFVGSFLGPALFAILKWWVTDGKWRKLRKNLIKKKFAQVKKNNPPKNIISKENMTTWCLCSETEIDQLILELGGEGVVMSDGRKGVTLEPQKVPQKVLSVDDVPNKNDGPHRAKSSEV